MLEFGCHWGREWNWPRWLLPTSPPLGPSPPDYILFLWRTFQLMAVVTVYLVCPPSWDGPTQGKRVQGKQAFSLIRLYLYNSWYNRYYNSTYIWFVILPFAWQSLQQPFSEKVCWSLLLHSHIGPLAVPCTPLGTLLPLTCCSFLPGGFFGSCCLFSKQRNLRFYFSEIRKKVTF